MKKKLLDVITKHVVDERLDINMDHRASSLGSAKRGQYWYNENDDVSYCVLERGDLSAVPRLKANWQYVAKNGQVILSCPSCGGLNDATDWYVLKGGFVGYECVTCALCGLHYWPYLRGWNKLSAKIRGKFEDNY